MTNGPVLIDLEGTPSKPGPDVAPPVPEVADVPHGKAMQAVAAMSARPRSRFGRWVLGLAVAILGVVISVAAYDFALDLIARIPLLGYAVTVLIAVFVAALIVAAIRELAGFSSLKRLDHLRGMSEKALADEDLGQARIVVHRLDRLYRERKELTWARQNLAERVTEQFDASAVLALAEAELMLPLDQAARNEVEAAARQVATVTALVPLAFADVAAAFTVNVRMIRRIAEIYGGRAGALGSWRLTRAVLAHLVATGAVAVGDDLIGSLAGGGILGKLSRRFGEGVVNGALTARVGVAAMEVCRPLPFGAGRRPSVSNLMKNALSGLFGKE